MSKKNSKPIKKKKVKKRNDCKKHDTNKNSNIEGNSYCSNNSSNQSNDNNNSKLCCFSSVDYIVLASTLAIALGEELSTTDVEILSTFFAVLSDELALIASVKECSNNKDETIFVPPVPDVALTSSKKNINKKNIKKKK